MIMVSPRGLATTMAFLALAGGACRHPGPPPSDREAPPSFTAQIQAVQGDLEPWAPWFETLRGLSSDDFCAETLCLRWNSQRLMWDEALTDQLADTSVLSDPTTQSGPLITIIDFARQLEQLDVELLVAIVPPSSAVYPELISATAPLTPSETPPLLDWRLRAFYAALAEAGVEVIDLLPPFLEHRYGEAIEGAPGPGRELLFQGQDPHWTPHGAAVAAVHIIDRVRRYPWFEQVVASQGEAHWVESSTWYQEHGSIAQRLLASGKIRQDLPEDRWRQITVRIEGERWSLNDRQSPIVLLGDSFSGPAYGFPDQLLKNLGFRVDSLVVAGGVPTAALKALRFRGDRLTGKRLVIWELTAYSLQAQDRWQPVDVIGNEEGQAS